MLSHNQAFEWMIHIMELSVVLGIIAVTWYVKTHKSGSKDDSHENDYNSSKSADFSAD